MSRGGGKKGRSSPGFGGFSASPLGFCRRLRWANVFFPPLRTPRIFRAGGGDGKSSPAPSGGQNGGKKTPKPKNQTKPKPKPNPLSSKGPWATGVSSTAPVRARGVPLYLRACKNIPNSTLSPGGCGGFGVWFGFGVCFLVLGFFLPQTAAFSPPRSTASTKYNCDG